MLIVVLFVHTVFSLKKILENANYLNWHHTDHWLFGDETGERDGLKKVMRKRGSGENVGNLGIGDGFR